MNSTTIKAAMMSKDSANFAVPGIVSYDVEVDCPHCGTTLYLNQYPYNDDRTDYCPAEDDLGLALFGTTEKPTIWEGLAIEYKCFGCDQQFTVSNLTI